MRNPKILRTETRRMVCSLAQWIWPALPLAGKQVTFSLTGSRVYRLFGWMVGKPCLTGLRQSCPFHSSLDCVRISVGLKVPQCTSFERVTQRFQQTIWGGPCWTGRPRAKEPYGLRSIDAISKRGNSLSTDKPGRLSAMVCFVDRHPTQERTGIGSIPMKLHHPVEEFAHAGRLLAEAQEVPEVAARFLDDPWVIVVLRPFVTGNHGPRFQQFEFVE